MGTLGRFLNVAWNALHSPPVHIHSQSPVLWYQYANVISPIGSVRHYALRKGTRARKEKVWKANKARNERKRIANAAERQRTRKTPSGKVFSLIPDTTGKSHATDNVWQTRYHKWPVFSVREAIANIKESHHPTMYDLPKAQIKAYFELDMTTKKKTTFVTRVQDVLVYPHTFESERPRQVYAVCKTDEQVQQAMDAGAANANRPEICVQSFQDGVLNDEDYEYFVADLDAVNEITALRGILLHKFPKPKSGQVGYDIVSLVKKFRNGVAYAAQQNAHYKALGVLEASIGVVEMPTEHLEANFKHLVASILTFKARNSDSSLIIKGMLTCKPSPEGYLLDLEPTVGPIRRNDDDVEEEPATKPADGDEDDDNIPSVAAAKN